MLERPGWFGNATNLVEGDTNGLNDVFVRDLMAETTTRVNVAQHEHLLVADPTDLGDLDPPALELLVDLGTPAAPPRAGRGIPLHG